VYVSIYGALNTSIAAARELKSKIPRNAIWTIYYGFQTKGMDVPSFR
jgi:hypothetical protein